MYKFYLILIIGFGSSCSSETLENSVEKESDFPITFDYGSPEDITEYKIGVLQGDTTAYGLLRRSMMDYQSDNDLFWSLHMAEVYDYGPACLDFYDDVTSIYQQWGYDLHEIDSAMANILLGYLDDAIRLGVLEAVTVKENFINTKPNPLEHG